MTGVIFNHHGKFFLSLFQLDEIVLAVQVSNTPVLLSDELHMVLGKENTAYLTNNATLIPSPTVALDTVDDTVVFSILASPSIMALVQNIGLSVAANKLTLSDKAIEDLKVLFEKLRF